MVCEKGNLFIIVAFLFVLFLIVVIVVLLILVAFIVFRFLLFARSLPSSQKFFLHLQLPEDRVLVVGRLPFLVGQVKQVLWKQYLKAGPFYKYMGKIFSCKLV